MNKHHYSNSYGGRGGEGVKEFGRRVRGRTDNVRESDRGEVFGVQGE